MHDNFNAVTVGRGSTLTVPKNNVWRRDLTGSSLLTGGTSGSQAILGRLQFVPDSAYHPEAFRLMFFESITMNP